MFYLDLFPRGGEHFKKEREKKKDRASSKLSTPQMSDFSKSI